MYVLLQLCQQVTSDQGWNMISYMVTGSLYWIYKNQLPFSGATKFCLRYFVISALCIAGWSLMRDWYPWTGWFLLADVPPEPVPLAVILQLPSHKIRICINKYYFNLSISCIGGNNSAVMNKPPTQIRLAC